MTPDDHANPGKKLPTAKDVRGILKPQTAADHANTEQTLADRQALIRGQGMCGETSPGGERICILAPGHSEPHPWDKVTAADHANTLREAVDDALIVFEGTQWERAYRNTLRPALDALQTQTEEWRQRYIITEQQWQKDWARAEAAEAERDRARDALRAIAEMERWVQAGPLIDIARAALGDTT